MEAPNQWQPRRGAAPPSPCSSGLLAPSSLLEHCPSYSDFLADMNMLCVCVCGVCVCVYSSCLSLPFTAFPNADCSFSLPSKQFAVDRWMPSKSSRNSSVH